MRINWFGATSSGEGYSGSGEQTVLALEKRDDIDMYTVAFKKVPDVNISKEMHQIKSKPFKKAEVGLVHGIPNAFSSIQDYKYRVGYTMFETDRLPDGNNEWSGKFDTASKAINEQLDLLLTPSEWCVRMFRDNGVTIPIEVVPNGVHPKYQYVDRELKGDDDKFTFFDMATLTIRKNPGAVISAFTSLFRNNPNVALVLKTKSGTLGHLNFNKDMGDITVLDGLYTEDKIQELWEQADCFVFPSRGEGFGMPPIEAMATGLPTIVSYNTGMMDYADGEYCYPVKLSHKTPASRFPRKWGYVGNWYEPDYDDLKAQMKYVYEHRQEALDKGKKASEVMHRDFNYDVVADKLVEAIKKHFPEAYNKD